MQTDPTQGGGVCTTRSVSQWERALLAQWFANTERSGVQAIVAAYVSESSHDDPGLRNMIVVAEQTSTEISYLIHRPNGETAWVVTCGRTGSDLGRFRTLPEALHTIRPNRSMLESLPLSAPDRSEERLATALNER
jgi:hypothetical protein